MTNTLYVKNRDKWRQWLESNAAIEKDIWLIYYKKHTKKPTIAYPDAVEEALCFGWIDSTVKRIDEERYMQWFLPRKKTSKWSFLNKERAERMIKQNKMTEQGMKLIDEAKENLVKHMNRHYRRKFFREAYKESKKVTNYTKPKKRRKKR